MKRTRPLHLTIVVAGLTLFCCLLGCKPKKTVSNAADSVSQYALEVGAGAEKLGTKAGQTLGLVDKKWDYVRLAYKSGEQPTKAMGTYTLSDEREMGRLMGLEWIAKFGRYRYERMDRYLNRLAAALAAHSERPSLPATVIVLNTEEVRCFGAPGGFVFVTLGGLRAAESESDLAGYLALGLAHAQLNHSLALLEKIAGGALVFQDGTPKEPIRVATAAEETATLLRRNGYQNEDTRSASREATQLLLRLGYAPGGLKVWIQRTKVRKQEKHIVLSTNELTYARCIEEAVAERLAELHAPGAGRTNVPRFRRGCLSCLPIPRNN